MRAIPGVGSIPLHRLRSPAGQAGWAGPVPVLHFPQCWRLLPSDWAERELWRVTAAVAESNRIRKSCLNSEAEIIPYPQRGARDCSGRPVLCALYVSALFMRVCGGVLLRACIGLRGLRQPGSLPCPSVRECFPRQRKQIDKSTDLFIPFCFVLSFGIVEA